MRGLDLHIEMKAASVLYAFFKSAWKKNWIIIGISILFCSQIFVFLIGDGMTEKYSKKNSEIDHLHSANLRWERLKRELKKVEAVNKTLFNELLASITRQSVDESLFVLNSHIANRNLFVQKNFMTVKNGFKVGFKPSLEDPSHRILPDIPVSIKLPKTHKSDNRKLPKCSVKFSELRGRENVSHAYHGFNYLEDLYNDTEIGGRWRPPNCTASQRIAIILPYRDRDTHLKLLLFNLIPKLRRQKVDYTFYLVEQGHGSQFNRGMMRNIGFMEAREQGDYDCYIFNDVDTIIENDTNIYKCLKNKAYHMAPLVDIFKYRLPYPTLFGGIVSFSEELFLKVNGYSNFFFMWGAEDDDMWRRINRTGHSVMRPPNETSYITTLKHERDPKILERKITYKKVRPFFEKDGLNTLNYEIITLEKRRLFTWIYLKINETFYHELLKNYILVRNAELAAMGMLETTTSKSDMIEKENNKRE